MQKIRKPKSNPAFQFRDRNSRIDWKAIHEVRVEDVIRKVDIQALQELVNNITFAKITSEDWPFHSEGMSLKTFQLCQLIIEYLLHAQTQVVEIAKTNAEKCKRLHEQNKELQDKLKAKKEELSTTKDLLKEQQVSNAWPCPYCRSKFKTENYLKAHICRRHPEEGCQPVRTEDYSKIKEIEENAMRRIETALDLLRQQTEMPHHHERQLSNQSNISDIGKMFETMMAQQKEMYEHAIGDRLNRIEDRFERESKSNQAIIQRLSQSESVLAVPPPNVVPCAPSLVQPQSSQQASNAGELADLATKDELQSIIGKAILDVQTKLSHDQLEALTSMKNEILETKKELQEKLESHQELFDTALFRATDMRQTQPPAVVSDVDSEVKKLGLDAIEKQQQEMQEVLKNMEDKCNNSGRIQIKYGVRDVYCHVGHSIEALIPAVSGSPTEFYITPDMPTGLNIDRTNGTIYGTPYEATSDKTPCTIFATSKSGRKGSVMLNFHFVQEKCGKDLTSVRVGKTANKDDDFPEDLDEIRRLCELPLKRKEKIGKHISAAIIQRWWRKKKGKSTENKKKEYPENIQKHLRISSKTLEAEINKLESEWNSEKLKQQEKDEIPKRIAVNGSIAIVKELEGEYLLMGERFNKRPAYMMKSHHGKGKLGPSIFFYEDGDKKNWFLCRSGPKHQYECSAYSKEDVFHPGYIKCWISKASGSWKPDPNLIVKAMKSLPRPAGGTSI